MKNINVSQWKYWAVMKNFHLEGIKTPIEEYINNVFLIKSGMDVSLTLKWTNGIIQCFKSL